MLKYKDVMEMALDPATWAWRLKPDIQLYMGLPAPSSVLIASIECRFQLLTQAAAVEEIIE